MNLSRLLTLLVLLSLAVFLLALKPNTIENLIPYETASTLPPPKNSILSKVNPMPDAPYGPFPPNYPNAMPY